MSEPVVEKLAREIADLTYGSDKGAILALLQRFVEAMEQAKRALVIEHQQCHAAKVQAEALAADLQTQLDAAKGLLERVPPFAAIPEVIADIRAFLAQPSQPTARPACTRCGKPESAMIHDTEHPTLSKVVGTGMHAFVPPAPAEAPAAPAERCAWCGGKGLMVNTLPVRCSHCGVKPDPAHAPAGQCCCLSREAHVQIHKCWFCDLHAPKPEPCIPGVCDYTEPSQERHAFMGRSIALKCIWQRGVGTASCGKPASDPVHLPKHQWRSYALGRCCNMPVDDPVHAPAPPPEPAPGPCMGIGPMCLTHHQRAELCHPAKFAEPVEGPGGQEEGKGAAWAVECSVCGVARYRHGAAGAHDTAPHEFALPAEGQAAEPWVSENTVEEINRLRAVLVQIGREVEDGLGNPKPPAAAR